MTKYIVVVEFGKNKKFDNEEVCFDEICIDYIQELINFKSVIQDTFGNNIMSLSTTSYLIISDKTEKELLEIIKELIKIDFDKEFYDSKHQVYVAAINSFEYASFREKKLELEYINRD